MAVEVGESSGNDQETSCHVKHGEIIIAFKSAKRH